MYFVLLMVQNPIWTTSIFYSAVCNSSITDLAAHLLPIQSYSCNANQQVIPHYTQITLQQAEKYWPKVVMPTDIIR